MRNLNAGVLIPLVLSFAIGVLIYLYGTSRSQHKSLLENFRDVQRTASNLRSERDSLQYDLNKAKDESQQTLKEKEKALERAMVAEDKANRANDDLVCIILLEAKSSSCLSVYECMHIDFVFFGYCAMIGGTAKLI